MSEAIKVANVGDIEDEEAIVVDTETSGWDMPIAVFFSDGEYFALDNRCSHEVAGLDDGWIEGDQVECPIHAAKFSLRTGQALCPPAVLPVRTHQVEVRGDEIWLSPGVPVEGAVTEAAE